MIASLPQGAVILPGLDRDIDAEAWDEISDTHPQHSMKRLLGKMDVAREAVALWGENPAPSARLRLLREAMRPAALTEAWRGLRGQLDDRVVQGLTRVTLAHPQEEAQVIALRLRAVLEDPDKTAAFVTADRYLAMRVAALLQRWGIEVDDSGGASLGLLPLGAFLNLVLAAASPYARAVDFLALLKHPLTACGLSPALCRMQAREAERRARQGGEENFAALRKILEPLTESARSPLALVERIDAHVRVAETLAASDTESGAARLWRGETGADAALWLDEWRASAVDFPALSGADYAVLFKSLAATKTLRSLRATHPRLSILGPLEARLIDADCLVLGAMNESVWPPDPGFDPWMSRQMRQKFKLPAPEFRIGLSAHDFTQLVAAREVMVTRALRSEGTPTVPSRFLLQIETVLRAAGISEDTRDALAPVEPWREWAQALDMPQAITPCERPRPCPPVALRPTALSVTEVTTWLRNPYAIYAKHILKLKKLDELDAELDAADKGTMIHAALEEFARAYPGVLPVDAEARLLEIGQKVFRQNESNPRVRAFWWARFKDVAVWFVETERQRRAQGIRFLAAEPEGVLTMQGLTLKGRADRMDRLATGELAIIDYKTGGVPTQAEVVSGLEPQLQLLALIAEKGGFSSIPPAVSGALEYWVLKGGRSGCARQVQKEKIEDLVARAEEGVRNLVAAFADPATPYEAVPKPRIHPRYNDYAHLSRLAEWGRTGRES